MARSINVNMKVEEAKMEEYFDSAVKRFSCEEVGLDKEQANLVGDYLRVGYAIDSGSKFEEKEVEGFLRVVKDHFRATEERVLEFVKKHPARKTLRVVMDINLGS